MFCIVTVVRVNVCMRVHVFTVTVVSVHVLISDSGTCTFCIVTVVCVNVL
jgi:hypothetical protein